MTDFRTVPASAMHLKQRDAQSLRIAARLWLLAQALFLLGTAAYALAFSPTGTHWAWWLIYAAGPRFTTVGTGICPLAVVILCAAGWTWASWKLGGIGSDTGLAGTVRWGSMLLLFGVGFAQEILRIGGFAGPRYFIEAVVTAEALLSLAIALHLRSLGREVGDRLLNSTSDWLVGIVILNLVAYAPFWLGLESSRFLRISTPLIPCLRALAFVLVMAGLRNYLKTPSFADNHP